MNASPMLTVKNLTKRYGGQTVIRSLTFSLGRGERLAVFAPSGAGKSTLIHILARLEEADSGAFTLAVERPVILFQEPRLFQFLTVEENIFLPLKIQDRQISPGLRERYERWLEACELAEFRRHYPHQLSGGMRQKTALVRAMLDNPAFVMMDEPFQSIGAAAKRRIMRLMLETNPEASMLLVTHNADEIPALAHRALVFASAPLGGYTEVEGSAFRLDGMGLPSGTTKKEILPATAPAMDMDFHRDIRRDYVMHL